MDEPRGSNKDFLEKLASRESCLWRNILLEFRYEKEASRLLQLLENYECFNNIYSNVNKVKKEIKFMKYLNR